MKKLLILAAIFASTLLISCEKNTNDKDGNIVVGGGSFEDPNKVLLSFFSATRMPEYDTWVINDSEAVASDFEGVSAALAAIAESEEDKDDSEKSGRKISLVFPNLKEIPDFAMLGVDYEVYDEETDDFYYDVFTQIDFSEYNVDALVSVSAPAAESVGIYAFVRSYNLSTLDFPKVTTVDYGAFLYCSSIASLSSAEFPELETIEGSAFNLCKSLTSVDLAKVTAVGDNAFELCEKLSSVALNSAESIGTAAFKGCQLLADASFPEAVTIGQSAFSSCLGLISVDLPAATLVGKWAFNNCDVLESVNMPSAVNIGIQAFYSCSSLRSIELPAVESIYSGAFYSSALEVASFPSVTYIASDVFRDCNSLTELSLATNSDTLLETVDVTAFGGKYVSDRTDTTEVDLTIGSANSDYVDGNELTVGKFNSEFKSIALL